MRRHAGIAVEGALPQPPAQAAPLPLEQPPSPGRFRTLRPFAHRDFALFWSGALVSNTGTWLQNVALAWVVLELTESAFWVSMVTFTQFIPTLLFGLFGGLMADRLDRRRVLLVTQSLAMTFAAALAVVTWSGHASVATLLPIIGAAGITMAFNAPSFQALIPDLIPSRLILDAVSLNSTQFSIARVLGPALGGLILAAYGAGWAFAVNALTFVAVIAALLAIRTTRQEPPTSSGARALFGGVRAASESPAISSLLGATAIVSVFGAPVIALLSVMAKHVLNRGAGGYGGLFAMFSVGAVAGALATGVIVRRYGLRMSIGTGMGILAVLIALFAASRNLVTSSVLLVGIGAVYTLSVSATNSGLQTAVPARKRGRIMSLYMMAWGGLFPVGALIAGIMASHIGAPKTLGILAIPLAVGAAAIVVAGHRLDAVAKPRLETAVAHT
ncbi:MAG TPA: MFS transporter [Actinomycetota bacterium]|nr:MFS transporter [Actinomycetota bacterium]